MTLPECQVAATIFWAHYGDSAWALLSPEPQGFRGNHSEGKQGRSILKSELCPPRQLGPHLDHMPAALRRCLTTVETKKEGPELWKAATRDWMPPVRDPLALDRKPSSDLGYPWLDTPNLGVQAQNHHPQH